MKGPTVDLPPSHELHEEPELWYQQWSPQGVQTNLGKSLLVFEYPILVEILILFGGEQVTAPSRLERNWGWGLCEIPRADPLMV